MFTLPIVKSPDQSPKAGPAAPTEPFARLREEATAARRVMWLAAITKYNGNLTRVGEEFGFTRQRASALTKTLGLTDELVKIKAAAGQPARGGPPKRRS